MAVAIRLVGINRLQRLIGLGLDIDDLEIVIAIGNRLAHLGHQHKLNQLMIPLAEIDGPLLVALEFMGFEKINDFVRIC